MTCLCGVPLPDLPDDPRASLTHACPCNRTWETARRRTRDLVSGYGPTVTYWRETGWRTDDGRRP